MIYYGVETHYNSLAHYGVKGMKWGIRRLAQNINTNAHARMKRRRDHYRNRVRIKYANADERRRAANRSIGRDMLRSAGRSLGYGAAAGGLALASRYAASRGKAAAAIGAGLARYGAGTMSGAYARRAGNGVYGLAGNAIKSHTKNKKHEFYGINNGDQGSRVDNTYASVGMRKKNRAARYTY